ncbi:LTA synthase family protein [Fibrobacter sp. UWEL]|uniref:LTA synthase family protein n=1 Tax=Fibrobacter sp. UWEL TaxID=1896209 RepID=UPI00091A6373|nr:LTA synthase family protein [Fibrobacter sp. UWEL]SHK85371.1 Phosphoglycerol transferase MdoB [Fibrobacter sp. UWEL]
MKNFYWVVYGLLLWLARLAQLCFLYFMEMPTGGPIVDRWYRFFPHCLVAELGVVMGLSLLGFAGSLLIKKGSLRKVWGISFVVLGILYIWLSGGDDETMRWMGQHLSLSFFETYANAASDPGLVGRIFIGGIGHFGLNILWAILTSVAVVFLYRIFFRNTTLEFSKKAIISALILALLAATGLSSRYWFAPSKMRWKRIAPFAWHVGEEIAYKFSSAEKRGDYVVGIKALGGNPDAEYPFWHEVPNDAQNLDSFKKRPLDERPDVILFMVETFRGWTADVRVESTCKRLPNLCKLANSGLYFPNAHSVGYPSIEGFLGTLTGLWSHPRFTFLSDVPNTQMRALPDMLKDAGYHRMVLTATEPSFDNLNPWFERWFDYSEYKPENQHDVPIANRFRELYNERPKDKPLFFNWMSTSTHVPFTLPSEYGPTPKDLEEAYLRTMVYLDSALGIVLDEIRKGDRANNTLIVLTGDHAFANKAQHGVPEFIGGAQDGYTWVPLIVAGPGIEPQVVSAPVSHVNIGPTVLEYLGLELSNNFVGQSLIDNRVPVEHLSNVFSFRMDDVAMRNLGYTYYVNMEDESEWTVFGTMANPDWDTSHPVEGFVSARKLTSAPARAEEISREIRAAAFAWEYVVNNNKLMPFPQ